MVDMVVHDQEGHLEISDNVEFEGRLDLAWLKMKYDIKEGIVHNLLLNFKKNLDSFKEMFH